MTSFYFRPLWKSKIYQISYVRIAYFCLVYAAHFRPLSVRIALEGVTRLDESALAWNLNDVGRCVGLWAYNTGKAMQRCTSCIPECHYTYYPELTNCINYSTSASIIVCLRHCWFTVNLIHCLWVHPATEKVATQILFDFIAYKNEAPVNSLELQRTRTRRQTAKIEE